jgi:hypothetical protein
MRVTMVSLKASILAVAGIAVVLLGLRSRAGMQSLQPLEMNTPEVQQIVLALEEAYRLRSLVACDPGVDVGVLETALADTPDYQMDDGQRRMVELVFDEQAAQRAGYLTWMKAYYLSQRGYSASPTTAPQPGARPTPKPIFYCPTPAVEQDLDFKSIAISGDRALVQFDDGPALQEALLVRKSGQWFVASIRPLQIHL